MFVNVEEMIEENLTLLGIEDRLSDFDRGLNVNLKSIREGEDGEDEYIAIYEHPSHRVRATVYLDVFKTADEALESNLPPEVATDGRSPEHNGPRSHRFNRESAPDIHNFIFTVNHVEISDITKTYPEPM